MEAPLVLSPVGFQSALPQAPSQYALYAGGINRLELFIQPSNEFTFPKGQRLGSHRSAVTCSGRQQLFKALQLYSVTRLD